MKLYEGFFIFSPEETPENRKTQFKNLDDLFSRFQGEILHREEWGKKPLGYPIRKFKEGYFLVVDYRMNPLKTVEFQKTLQLQEDIMKFMITAKNTKVEKKPAPKTQETTKPQSSTQLPAQSATS